MLEQPEFWEVDERLKCLTDFGDHLDVYAKTVDFEIFRADLVAALDYSSGHKGDRPPFEPVMMFKKFWLSKHSII